MGERSTVYGVATGDYDEWAIRALFVDRADAERARDRLDEERDEDGFQVIGTTNIVELSLLPAGSDDLRLRRWVRAFGDEAGDRWHFDQEEVTVDDPPESVKRCYPGGSPAVWQAEAATLDRANELLAAALSQPTGDLS